MNKAQWLWNVLDGKRDEEVGFQRKRKRIIEEILLTLSDSEFDEIMAGWEPDIQRCHWCEKILKKGHHKTAFTKAPQIAFCDNSCVEEWARSLIETPPDNIYGEVNKLKSELSEVKTKLEDNISEIEDVYINGINEDIAHLEEHMEKFEKIINVGTIDDIRKIPILWNWYLEMQDKASKNVEWKDAEGNVWKMPCKEMKI